MAVGVAQFTGYHGTTQPFADNILKEGVFKESTKKTEWLGVGAYFFEDRDHAEWWARNQARDNGEPFCAVISVEITCPREAHLDMDTMFGFRQVESCYKRHLSKGLFSRGVPIFANDDEFRCFVVELYKRSHPEVKLVSYTFDSGIKTIIKFKARQKQHCVCDQAIISDIKIAYQFAAKGGNYI